MVEMILQIKERMKKKKFPEEISEKYNNVTTVGRIEILIQ